MVGERKAFFTGPVAQLTKALLAFLQTSDVPRFVDVPLTRSTKLLVVTFLTDSLNVAWALPFSEAGVASVAVGGMSMNSGYAVLSLDMVTEHELPPHAPNQPPNVESLLGWS